MARDLNALLQPLAIAADPGLDSLDPRFSAITTLASHGQYGPAADEVEKLLAEGIYDGRLLPTFLFQAFREAGIAGIGEVLEAVSSLLGDNFEAIGPLKRREETFDRRLAWLFTEIADTLQYHITGQTPTWTTLRADVTTEMLDAVLAKLTTATEQMTSRKLVRASRAAARLEGWLAGHPGAITDTAVALPAGAEESHVASMGGAVNVIDFTNLPSEDAPSEETPSEETSSEETPAEETPAEETPAEEAPAEETPAEETPAEETPAEETSSEEAPAEEAATAEEAPAEEAAPAEHAATPSELAPVPAGGGQGGYALQLAVTYRFAELTRKLQAFELLVQEGQFRKAALVADDLQQLIQGFDPRSYFPTVFASFSALFCENLEVLSEHWGERGSLAWQALGQFYQTDLDRFVKG